MSTPEILQLQQLYSQITAEIKEIERGNEWDTGETRRVVKVLLNDSTKAFSVQQEWNDYASKFFDQIEQVINKLDYGVDQALKMQQISLIHHFEQVKFVRKQQVNIMDFLDAMAKYVNFTDPTCNNRLCSVMRWPEVKDSPEYIEATKFKYRSLSNQPPKPVTSTKLAAIAKQSPAAPPESGAQVTLDSQPQSAAPGQAAGPSAQRVVVPSSKMAMNAAQALNTFQPPVLGAAGIPQRGAGRERGRPRGQRRDYVKNVRFGAGPPSMVDIMIAQLKEREGTGAALQATRPTEEETERRLLDILSASRF